jgi:hypothetical protein
LCADEGQSPANASPTFTTSLVVKCPPPVSYITCYKWCDCSTGKVLCKTKYARQNCVDAKPPCKCVEQKTTTTSVKPLATSLVKLVKESNVEKLAAPNVLRCPAGAGHIPCKKFCVCDGSGKLSCSAPRAIEKCMKGRPSCKCTEPTKTTTTNVKLLVTPASLSSSADEENESVTAETALSFTLICKLALKLQACSKACTCISREKPYCNSDKTTKDCTQGGLACSCVPNKATHTKGEEQHVTDQPEL